MAANCGILSERILYLLGRTPTDIRPRVLGLTGGLLLLGTALAAGSAVFGIAHTIPSVQPSLGSYSIAPLLQVSGRYREQVDPFSLQTHNTSTNLARRNRDYAPGTISRVALRRRTDVSKSAHNESAILTSQLVHVADVPPVDFSGQDLRQFAAIPSITPVTANGPQTLAITASTREPNAVVCRVPQQLPGSRFYGPRVCLTTSDWTQLRAQGKDVGPDGLQVVERDAYEKERLRRRIGCIAPPASSSNGAPVPVCF
jgi:hypothetical protein